MAGGTGMLTAAVTGPGNLEDRSPSERRRE